MSLSIMKAPIYSLGFMNYCSHDPAACIVRKLPDGRTDYIHFEEGMISRKKKSYHFPTRSIQKCLDYYQITIDEVDVICVDYMNDKSFHNTASYYRKLVGDYIRARLKVDKEKIHFIDSHHLAHAYTAFYPSTFEESAILVIDGLGSEQDTHSIYLADHKSGLKKIYSQKGTGIGQLYSLITSKLGFESGEEGKTMGLAPYGRNHTEIDKKIPSLKGQYNGYCVSYIDIMHRQPSPRLLLDIDQCPNTEMVYSPYYSRLAFNIQKELESCLLHIASQIKEKLGAKRLCLAGGVALNCVANEIISASGIFDEIYVQPASGDTGIPLGLAMHGLEIAVKKDNNISHSWKENQDMYWTFSPAIQSHEPFKAFINNQKIPYSKTDIKVIAQKISEKNIIAYFEDGHEFGPRALGHRSFLADPRSQEMKDILNIKIKHREPYRPFAPIVLKEDFKEYFDSNSADHSHMLYAVKCHKTAMNLIPTVVHVDNTARVQTCSIESGLIYQIINEFKKITGISVLVNTSFNDNNEPIVLTPIDAFLCFLRTNANILVVDDLMIFREQVKDIKGLIEIVEKIQVQSLKEEMDRSLENLLNLSPSIESLDNFIMRNMLSSAYEKYNKSYDSLAKLFFDNKKLINLKCLFTDEYHLNILNNISIYYKKPIPFKNIQIVTDTMASLELIGENSYVLLYNISLLMTDKEINLVYKNLDTCSSFYKSRDKIIYQESGNNDFKNVKKSINDTYEFNKNESINSYFSNQIKHKFYNNFF